MSYTCKLNVAGKWEQGAFSEDWRSACGDASPRAHLLVLQMRANLGAFKKSATHTIFLRPEI